MALRNQDTGSRQQSKTNTDGFYSFPGLKPGTYQATVQAPGFRTLTRTIVLNVADRVSLDFALQLAGVGEKVTVIGSPAVANPVDPAVSTVVDQQFVQNMPLNGRSFQSLIGLTPGFVLTYAGGVLGGGTTQGQFSINGQRSDANYIMVDGVSANFGSSSNFDPGQTFDGGIPGLTILGGTNGLVSVDAMQEFRVQSANFDPEYGHSPGSQISIVTRSGTNQFHGTAFDYLRNEIFDARNFFDMVPMPKPPLRQNDFGGALGGPIRKNKTFFFVSYEGLRLLLPQTDTGTFYTAAARANVAPAFQPLLAALPLPQGPINPDGLTGNLSVAYSDPSSLDSTSVRIDHTLTPWLTLFGRYSHAPSMQSTRTWSKRFMQTANSDTVTLGATALIRSNQVNDFRANWSRQTSIGVWVLDNFYGAVPPPDSAMFPAGYSSQTSQFIIEFPDGDEVRSGKQRDNIQRQLTFVDTYSLSVGTHQLKFGGDFRRLSPTSSPYEYSPLFFTDTYSSLQTGLVSGESTEAQSTITARMFNASVFAQDVWRATNRLTLTYGLRWEMNTPPASTTPGSPLYAVTGIFDSKPFGLAPAGTPLWHTQFTNFAPRVGAAWQIDPKTVLRGGFGLFYDLGYGGGVGNAMTDFPYARSTSINGNLPFDVSNPAFAAPPFTLIPIKGTTFLTAVDPNLRLPVVYEWNLAFQRELGGNQFLSVTYVGSHGHNLLREDDIQQPPSGFPEVFSTRNADWSKYRALQVQFQRRMTRGFQVLASYALAKSIDTSSSDVCQCSESDQVININVAGEKGPSDFDVRNAFSGAISYELPALARDGFARKLFTGWAIDGIVQSSSAAPYDLEVSAYSPVSGYYQTRPNIVPGVPFYLPAPGEPGGRMLNPAAFSAPTNGQPGDLPRNYFRGFPINQTDLAVRRRFALTERFQLDARVEYFNVFNHPMFSPNEFAFGQITQTLNAGLGTLNPLYQVGGPRSAQFTLKLQF